MVIGLLLDDTLDRSDGVQQAVIAIGAELSKRGHEVHYVVTDTKRTDIKNIHSLGSSFSIKFNGNSVRTPIPTSKKVILNLFDQVKFDVLHVQMPYSPLFTAKVLKYAPSNVKKFGTFHILPYSKLSSYGTNALGTIMKKNIKSLDKVFAVSAPANEFMYKSFGVKGDVIANPVDYEFYNSFTKKKTTKKKQIVFLGRFEERKGVSQLVKAYAGLSQELLENTELVMCGKGPNLDEVKKYSDANKLNIIFPGFVSEIEKAQYMTDADIAVFPSISGESFGIVLAEAMSAGAGVTLGGNNPGYSSVLGEWPEVLFNPLDIKEFTNVLTEFLTNDKKRTLTGKSQHIDAKNYDINIVVDELERNYEK